MTRNVEIAGADLHAYRPDIDGLRAVAVLSVLLFHLGVAPFNGGFVGVDIFFVISGYLITRIIHGELREGTFSLAHFYVRRIRRIFPALYLTVALTLAAGYVLLDTHELRTLLDTLRHLAVFISNEFFKRAGGYFDSPLESNAALQTWSLSVEEQFYIGFPLALMLAYRYARPFVGWIVVAAAVLSFALAAISVNLAPEKAFFATEVRIFELLIGSIVALGLTPKTASQTVRSLAAIIGFTLMVASIFLLDGDFAFPGPAALPVCLGAALVIWAGEQGTVTPVGRLLAMPPLVGVGLISYSVYLLHWPLIVYAKRALLIDLTSAQQATIFFVSLAAGYLSWRFVERPFRRPREGSDQKVFATAVALIALLGGGAWGSVLLALNPPAEMIAEAERFRKQASSDPCLLREKMEPDRWNAATCILRTTDATGKSADGMHMIAVWGDSYAAHYFNSMRDLARARGIDLVLMSQAACPPAAGLIVKERPPCARFNERALQRLMELKPAVVLLSAHWLNYEKRISVTPERDVMHHLRETIEKIVRNGSKVLVVGPSPIFPSKVPHIAASKSSPASEGSFQARYSKIFEREFDAWSAAGLVTHVPAYRAFCTEAKLCRFRDGERLLFWDSGHMTRAGADRVVTMVDATPTMQSLYRAPAE